MASAVRRDVGVWVGGVVDVVGMEGGGRERLLVDEVRFGWLGNWIVGRREEKM